MDSKTPMEEQKGMKRGNNGKWSEQSQSNGKSRNEWKGRKGWSDMKTGWKRVNGIFEETTEATEELVVNCVCFSDGGLDESQIILDWADDIFQEERIVQSHHERELCSSELSQFPDDCGVGSDHVVLIDLLDWFQDLFVSPDFNGSWEFLSDVGGDWVQNWFENRFEFWRKLVEGRLCQRVNELGLIFQFVGHWCDFALELGDCKLVILHRQVHCAFPPHRARNVHQAKPQWQNDQENPTVLFVSAEMRKLTKCWQPQSRRSWCWNCFNEIGALNHTEQMRIKQGHSNHTARMGTIKEETHWTWNSDEVPRESLQPIDNSHVDEHRYSDHREDCVKKQVHFYRFSKFVLHVKGPWFLVFLEKRQNDPSFKNQNRVGSLWVSILTKSWPNWSSKWKTSTHARRSYGFPNPFLSQLWSISHWSDISSNKPSQFLHSLLVFSTK